MIGLRRSRVPSDSVDLACAHPEDPRDFDFEFLSDCATQTKGKNSGVAEFAILHSWTAAISSHLPHMAATSGVILFGEIEKRCHLNLIIRNSSIPERIHGQNLSTN